MRLDLKKYSRPSEYAEIYSHNFRAVNGIQGDDLLNGFAVSLSRVSDIPYDIVLTDFKDYLMNRYEYDPGALRPNVRNELLLPYFILSLSKRTFAKKYEIADVIVDTWYSEAVKTFYTTKLESSLLKEYRCLFVDFNSLSRVRPVYLLRYLFPFVLSLVRCRKIIRKHNLDLRQYAYFFFKRLITGLTIKEYIKPKLVISGNDNGFAFITAKAAKAEVMLIQNGKRPLGSYFAFKYADHYIAMGDMRHMISSGLTNHIFRNVYNFGSIRLYNNCKMNNNGDKILYDILWVSTLDSKTNINFRLSWGQWYDYESECRAIKLINDLSKKTDLKIAFQCRINEEIKELEAEGLRSGKITYITPAEQDVYATLRQSRVVLSPLSTICVEAMGLGKKVGFVNLSGNEFMNYFFKDLDIEFNLESRVPFESFVNKTAERELDYKDYFIQNQNYIGDLFKVIKNILVKQ